MLAGIAGHIMAFCVARQECPPIPPPKRVTPAVVEKKDEPRRYVPDVKRYEPYVQRFEPYVKKFEPR